MILTDLHNHSSYSADGKSSLGDMVSAAKEKGVRYFGVCEHFDFDYCAQGITYEGKTVPYTDAKAYFSAIRRLQKENDSKDGFRLLAGGELGYAPLQSCYDEYNRLIETYRPDYIVNGVHTYQNADFMSPEYFTGKSKDYAYRTYLERVRESLEAPYHYDIVAHIGYVSRQAPYKNPKINYEDYPAEYDDILKTIIKKDKILEINSSARKAGSEYLPDFDILWRYRALGGFHVSFGSDAHDTSRICDGRETVIAALKNLGFTHITVPIANAPNEVTRECIPIA